MSLKNLSVKNKIHKRIFNYLNNKKLLKTFKEFENAVKINENLALAVSGGPDSLSLAFLAKCYALKHKVNIKCFIVDHRLRKESSIEAKTVKKILKKINLNCKILIWKGKKPTKNIQSLAREKRYSLLVDHCKKNNINNLLVGHHLDDLSENFLIRIVRGSGLNGLVSLDKRSKYKNQNFNIIRPLLDIEKKDLIYVAKEVFNFFINDPSNFSENFKRTRIRNLLLGLEKEGFDKKKLILTIKNLKDADRSIKFYVDKNLKNNAVYVKSKNSYILNQNFFDQSHEVVFRSLTKIIQIQGMKFYPVRGKNIDNLMNKIYTKSFSKVTLGGCFVEMFNKSIVISKENKH
jgi:tRNA(Ile)-lysidine synthase